MAPEVVTRDVFELSRCPWNPRIWSDELFQSMADSLRRFGRLRAYVVWADAAEHDEKPLTILAGNLQHEVQTFLVEKEGFTREAPCIDFHGTPEEARAVNIALNSPTALAGRWDKERLRNLLKELKDKGFDLKLTGLHEKELNRITKSLNERYDEIVRGKTRRDLFAGYMDTFESWWDSFGVLPVSVWNANAPEWAARRRALKDKFFAFENARAAANVRVNFDRVNAWKSGRLVNDEYHASLFDPVLAEVILKAYAPCEGARVYDPFAGDTRSVVAAGHGYEYVGVELREEEAAGVREHLKALNLRARIITADSAKPVDVPDGWADMAFSCPPYGSLEVYSEDPDDLSFIAARDYDAFLERYGSALAQVKRILKTPAFMVLVVGNYLHDGRLRDFRRDTVEVAKAAGFALHDEVIYFRALGSMPTMGYSFRANRRAARVHEYVLVFLNGELEDFRLKYGETTGSEQ